MNTLPLLHAGSTSVALAQDEDTGKRLIRSATEKEGEEKTKKKSEKRKRKGKKRKAMVKKGKSVNKITLKKGKRQIDNQGKKKNRTKKLKGRRKTKQSIVFTGENCDFIDFASVRALGAGCADGTKMVVKNK